MTRLDPADLVVSASAACPLAELDAQLAAAGVWLALDPPGPRSRTLGETLGNGAGGPLAARYGPPRDQVIGMTFTAGDGVRVKTGGRVVKNVAGFDLAKLLIGGQGQFGTIEEVHLRLRAVPEADETRAWKGSRSALAEASRKLMLSGAMLASFEIHDDVLFARAQGTSAGVREELDATAECLRGCVPVDVSTDVWERWSADVGAWPVIARIGADPDAWADAVAMAEACGATAFSATVPRGTVRARFAPGAVSALKQLRVLAARRGWPMTLEHAGAAMMAEVGVWGAMNAGTERLVEALQAAFGRDRP